MKIGEAIIKYSKNISAVLIFAVVFSLPIFTSAATLPLGGGLDVLSTGMSGIDSVKQLLEGLRRQAGDSVSSIPGLERPQAQFESELAKYRTIADQLGSYVGNVNSLINIGKNLNSSNIATQLPQVLDLVSKVTSFQGGGGATQLLNSFNNLKNLGVTGFPEAASDIIKGISAISNFDGGISNISNIAQQTGILATDLNTVSQQALQGLTGGFLGGGAGGIASGAAQEAIRSTQEKLLSNIGGLDQTLTSSVSNLGNSINNNAIQDKFQTAGIAGKGQEQSVCDKPSPSVTGGGGGNGVPVIEQAGPLLDLTGKLVDFTSNIRVINKETCYKIEQLWKKEFELDKKVKEDAQKVIEQTKKELDKQFAEGRTPANDLKAKKSFATTPKELLGENLEAGGVEHVDLLKKSGLDEKTKTLLTKQFEQVNEISKSDSASYLAKVNPTYNTQNFVETSKNLNGASFFDGLVNALNPRNNFVGQYLTQISERQKIMDKATINTLAEYIAGQGIVGAKQCTKMVKSSDGKDVCLEWGVTTPAKTLADVKSAYATENLKSTSEANDISDVSVVSNAAKDPQVIEAAIGASTGGGGGTNSGNVSIPGGVIDESGAIPGGNGGGFSIDDLLNLIGGGETGNEQTTPEPVALPLPIISIDQFTENLGNGVMQTILSWSADNAISCRVNNPWITYSDKATTTSEILIPTFSELAIDDNTIVYNPAAFSFSVFMTGINRAPNVPQPAIINIVKDENGLKQTVRYEPNLIGLIESDIFMISIDDNTIPATFEGETKSELVQKIKNILDNTDPLSERGKVVSTLTSEVDGDFLVLTKSVDNVLATADYEISCQNVEGGEAIKKTTIEFFK